MPSSTITCPYCDATNQLSTLKETSTMKYGDKVFQGEDSSTREFLSSDVECILCGRKYKFIELQNYSWVTQKLDPSETMIVTFKSLFPVDDFNVLSNSIIGVVRPKGRVRALRDLFKQKKRLHIIFEIGGKRAYIDGHQEKDTLRGLNIFEV